MRGAGGVTAADRGVSAGSVPYLAEPPSDATTVAEQLDWQQRHIGNRVVIASYADLQALFPAAGGVHTITAVVEVAGTVTLPAGVRIALTSTGLLTAPLAVRAVIAGNVADVLVSGTNTAIQGITLVNASSDPAASHLGSSGPGTTILNRVICAGAARVGTLTLGASGEARIVGCAWQGCANGLLLEGAMLGVRADNCVASAMPANTYAFAIGSTAAATVGVSVVGCALFVTQANQYLLRIDPGATLPAGQPTIRVQGCSVRVLAGSGQVLDQTGLTAENPGVFATANLNGERSLLLGHTTFYDLVNRISKTFAVPNTFEVLPYSNGAGGNMTLVPTSQRFSLVQDGLTWYLEYTGNNGSITCRLHWMVTVQRSGGGSSTFSVRVEHYDVGLGAWAAVPGIPSSERQQNIDPESVYGFGTVAMNTGDRLRLTASDSGTATSLISAVSLLAEALV